jgi:hypothetical protein
MAADSKLETNKNMAWSLLLSRPHQPPIQLESQLQQLLGIKDQSGMFEHLKQIDPSLKKSIQFLQLYGAQQNYVGQHDSALAALEAAFRLTAGQKALEKQHQHLALDLAVYHHQRASDDLALAYLNNVLGTSHTIQPIALLTRAKIHCWQGELETAQQDLLEVWNAVQKNPALHCYFAHTNAELAFAKQQFFEAYTQFFYAAQQAREENHPELVLASELGAAKVMLCLQDRQITHKHLKTVQACKYQSVYTTALFELRYGQWCRANSPQFALNHFANAFWRFEQTNCPREMLWVLLHQSDAFLKLGDTKAATDGLETALGLAWKFQDATAASELWMLPDLKAWMLQHSNLERLTPLLGQPAGVPMTSTVAKPKPTIKLTTLGRTALHIDGQLIVLEMQRTIEILAYLCLNPNANLTQIRQDLFPSLTPKRAANHFHKVRERLHKTTQDLEIAFDKSTQTYALRHQHALEWDYQTLQSQLGQPIQIEAILKRCSGVFLPHSDGVWASTLRERLALELHCRGVEALFSYKKTNRFVQMRTLSEHLYRLEPLEPEFCAAYLESTFVLSGKSVAKKLLGQMQAHFVSELGEMPVELTELLQRLSTQ